MEEKPDLRHRDVSNGKVEKGIAEATPTSVKIADTTEKETGTCTGLRNNCLSICSPCLVSLHPLPENPTLWQKFLHACRLPPHGNVASYLQFGIVCLQIWIILYTLTHGQALPGGNFFSLLILFICCAAGGYLISFARLPPLLGMLIVGVLLRNIPSVSTIGENIDTAWSSVLKKVALTVILTRAGLGLDVVKLKKLSWAVLRLAFTPCLVEIITGAVVSKFLLGFPWTWSWMLGCILGALSPAVTVPSLVNLQDRRYGVAKGIPTMLLAAGGLDNVLCITGFSVFLGIIFSEGDLAVTIIKGPLGAVAGVVYGFIMGTALWYIPAKDTANPVFYRSLMLFLAGMIAIFGSSEVGLDGAGPLGCLTTATVANFKWRQRRKPGETDEVSGVMGLSWLIVQHFLFGLIGSAVNVSSIKSSTAGLGIATLAIGLVFRSIASYTVTLGTGFNLKERGFIVMTWLSKATVQAAIGGLALDRVNQSNTQDPEQLRLATDILTIAVLAIIICAPTGATLMAIFGPKFLQRGDEDDIQLQVVTHSEKPPLNSISSDTETRLDDTEETLEPESPGFAASVLEISLPSNNDSEPLAAEPEPETIGIVNPCFEEPVTVAENSKDDSAAGSTENDISVVPYTKQDKVGDEKGVNDNGTDRNDGEEQEVKEIYRTVVDVRAPSADIHSLDDIDNNNTS